LADLLHAESISVVTTTTTTGTFVIPPSWCAGQAGMAM